MWMDQEVCYERFDWSKFYQEEVNVLICTYQQIYGAIERRMFWKII